MKQVTDSAQARQSGEADVFLNQEAVCLILVTFAHEMRGRNRFGEGVDALKVLAVVRHHFAGTPQVVQRERAVLAAAIVVRSRARRRREVAVGHRAALVQDGPHLDERIGVFEGQGAKPRAALTLATHDHAPVGQLVHRAGGQPAAPVEEAALLIGQLLPLAGPIREDAAVERDVVAAGDDLQRVELQVFHRTHGLVGALKAVPAPPRPQALLAENEATGGRDVDGQHTDRAEERLQFGRGRAGGALREGRDTGADEGVHMLWFSTKR